MKWEQRQDKKEISQRHFVYEPPVINPQHFSYLVNHPHLSDENILHALLLDKHLDSFYFLPILLSQQL